MDGLKNKIKNNEKRKKHIIEKQLYMGEINKKNCLSIKQIFNLNNDYKLNLYEGDTLNINLKKIFNVEKFDIIIGNPPYNEELKKTGAKPLYNKFIEFYIDKCNMLSFVVPSRWFAGGKGLDNFRKMMINRTDIVYINHYNNACTIFGNFIDIGGGVNYFLIDHKYRGLCNYDNNMTKLNTYDIVVNGKYYNIIEKLNKYNKITKLYLGRYFGIETNDKNLTDNKKLVKCYVSKQKGFIKYIDKKYIKKDYNFYKVITVEANKTRKNGFGNSFIGNIDEVYTGSYIGFKISTQKEAISLLSYIKCKLPNFMLKLRKITQHINEDTCKWIPLPPLNRTWSDEKIYKYFKLSNNDIQLIKNS
jgi:site-specific DNA-methyltransferase (adenine-specific)